MSERIQGDQLEAEAHALESVFNAAAPSYSPELEWFAMGSSHDTGDIQFVFEAPRYIDSDGIAALRDHGWEIQYIEAYEFDGEVRAQIQLPVRGKVPDGDFIEVAELRDSEGQS